MVRHEVAVPEYVGVGDERTRRRRLEGLVAGRGERGEVRVDLFDNQRRRDHVARLLALEQGGILHFVGHHHRRHEALDILVVHDYFFPLGIEAEDLTADLVSPRFRRLAARRCGCHHQDDTAKPSHVLNSIK